MPNQLPYDTSFVYAFQWSRPEEDLGKALDILNAQLDEMHDGGMCLIGRKDYEQVEVLLASNPSTPAQVLDHISQCVSCSKVLERVALHPNVDAKTLKRLAESDNREVRSAVAENENADLEILRLLSSDGSADVRFCLAENPNIPEEILRELSQDENPYVAYRAQSTLTKIGAKSAPVTEMTLPQKRIRRAV